MYEQTFLEPALAWRTWIIGNHAPRLMSVTRTGYPPSSPLYPSKATDRQIWPYVSPMKAKCRAHPEHSSPEDDCSCGIYGTTSFPEAHEWLGWNHRRDTGVTARTAVGLVRLWGNVVEHETGFRAEFAYPAELWLLPCSWRDDDDGLDELAAMLVDFYRVPVHIAEHYREVEGWDRVLTGQHARVPDEWLFKVEERKL